MTGFRLVSFDTADTMRNAAPVSFEQPTPNAELVTCGRARDCIYVRGRRLGPIAE